MEGFLCSIANSLLDGAKALAVQHMGYLVCVGKNVKALGDTLKDLQAKRDDINERIQREERQLRKPTHTVEEWRQKVKALETEVDKIVSDYDQRSCRCLGGCSLNCWSNYWTGKDAADKLPEVKEELEKGDFAEVTAETLAPPVQEMPTTSIKPGEQMESLLEEAFCYLKDNETGIIGIWGMGGVGKTTLLEHINNSLVKDSLGFHQVIFIVASRDCTIEKVQGLIVKKLGLPKEGDAAAVIFNFLSTKNFVLLLDDLWEPLDLKKVGIPLPLGAVDQLKRKVILTTRHQRVCNNMEAHRKIKVECLDWDAAWRLFQEKVGPEVLINSHPEIRKLAEKVAKECDGLPLALITVGRAMAGNETIEEWEHAIELLQTSRLSMIPGTDKETDPFPLLKISFDYLKDSTMQECFLCCALWPEDASIRKDELIECWMGQGLIDKFDNINQAYHIGHSIIGSLQAACLLELVGQEDEYTLLNTHVKLHDVIRDMALWIVGEKWIAGSLEALKEEEKWSKAHKVSLMWNNIEALPSRIPSCPNLTTLILRNNMISRNKDFTNFHCFHALKYLDLSHNFWIESFPIQICNLVQLQYLNLSWTKIKSLPEELKHLKNLKYLLLRRIDVSSIPNGLMSNLQKLLVLDVFNPLVRVPQRSILDQLDCLEGRLKALGINVSTVSDLQKISRIPTRALNIHSLEALPSLQLMSSDLLGSRNMLSTLKELIISWCHDNLEYLVIEGNHPLSLLESLDLTQLYGLKEIIWKGVAPKDLLPRLRWVTIENCPQLKHATWVLHLSCLEILSLSDCQNMKHMIDMEVAEIEVEEQIVAFPRLRTLILWDLSELGSICDRAFTFPSLEVVEVRDCPKLKKLPFKLHTTTNKLRLISGQKQWWEGLQWEDDNIRSSLLPLFKEEN